MEKNNETGFNWIEAIGSSTNNSIFWRSKPREITFNNITINGVIVPTKEKPPTEFQLFEKVKELIKKAK